ncbi:conserved hypothetical protein [Vibrio cholerae O1 str. 2010EL-1786]|uniref:Uncharacterized protein n=3 Tax=Vibrio cholerae TaxID=666 RepID=Q9KS76_VIBCH|nr:hypothetical protein VC_1383 [Vibrio cholerae O1 biovar El Tor str. N16961]ACP05654.1 conserved hypothetical protein [Vibrio cholerae M66-2]ACP09508.1 conserved hypothetical protein [Vibrio cholerae O395]AET26487.1 conserved hypothetical protein [Vibrio cholerae O1 str. 2010EL-1786]EET22624.1 conserved hypothetical protein [Vibrio cholerae MO10]KKP16504.1 hypothetical protein VS84_00209 [Vibrio cholerae]
MTAASRCHIECKFRHLSLLSKFRTYLLSSATKFAFMTNKPQSR